MHLRRTHLAEVVQLKDELFGQVVDSSPDDPSHTDRTYHLVSPRPIRDREKGY